MDKKILLLTTMYPDPLRPGTKVCHYFATQWVTMGYEVLVVNYRSMFPRIYTDMARLFPKLAERYIGNHVEMDTNMEIIQHEVDGIHVYSIPIYKYFPHGAYSDKEISKQVKLLKDILEERNYTPDIIIGHFYNPQMVIIPKLKELYPNAKTCLSLHEWYLDTIKKTYPKKYERLLKSFDIIGYRSVPIKHSFEAIYGNGYKGLLCFSGTAKDFLEAKPVERTFCDGALTRFIFVGQFIQRKYPVETIKALHNVYGKDGDFSLTFVGKKYMCYPKMEEYIKANRLEEKVTFTGQIPRDGIIPLYDNAECFIMISKYEVFGLVYLEAMSRGCLTIAARNEGMDGIIVDGVNGFLCEAGNEKELESIILRIKSLSATEKKRISQNAIKTARDLSDYNVAKSYIQQVENA